MGFTVAIIGRPNVGKSTLFNRLTGERHAIVDDISGVTRDRHYGMVEWNGKTFDLIDTGGFVAKTQDVFEKEIRRQVEIAIEESNVLLFMMDVTTGITDFDDDVIRMLRRSKKKVLAIVNKVDNNRRQLEAAEFYAAGFSDIFFVSSVTGSGTGDMLDAITACMEEEQASGQEALSSLPRFAIVGQPNVGKSTLLNALTNQERTLVTDIAGTTRDAIDTHYNLFGKEFILTDTAGLRKKNAVKEDLEFYTVIRAIKAIDESDVCLLLLDAQTGIESQDLSILQLIEKKKKGLVILVNKWDLLEKDNHTFDTYTINITERIAPFRDVPILFISAKDKTRIFKAMETALEVYAHLSTHVPTAALNEVMQEAMAKYHPPAVRGNFIKIKYVTQVPARVPTFLFFTNYPNDIRTPYKNYLENQLREHFAFSGVPIQIFFRKK